MHLFLHFSARYWLIYQKKTNIQNHQQSHDTTHSKTLHVERYRTKKLNNAKKKNRSITWVEILFEPNQLATIITTFDKIQWKFGFQLCCDSVYGTFWWWSRVIKIELILSVKTSWVQPSEANTRIRRMDLF